VRYDRFIPNDSSISHKYDLKYTELVFDAQIGKGSFGIVYRGHWRGVEVAIKELISLSQEEKESFIAEAKLMTDLKPHANVVTLYGIVSSPKHLIVTEFVPRGSLLTILEDKAVIISQPILKKIVTGIAAGMLHLHEEHVLHRDLAARNVLIGENWNVKLCDFGMSRKVESSEAHQTENVSGPLKWMSPESLTSGISSSKSDCWSFGITLLEIVTRQKPYPDLTAFNAARLVSERKLSPAEKIPANTPQILCDVMMKCWKFEPSERPDFPEMLDMLNSWNPTE